MGWLPREEEKATAVFKRRNYTDDPRTRKRVETTPTTIGTVTNCKVEAMNAATIVEWGGSANQVGAVVYLPAAAGLTIVADTDFVEVTIGNQTRELDIALVDVYPNHHNEIHCIAQFRTGRIGVAAGR